MKQLEHCDVLTNMNTWLSVADKSKAHIFIGANSTKGNDLLLPINVLSEDFGALTKDQAQAHLNALMEVIYKLNTFILSEEN